MSDSPAPAHALKTQRGFLTVAHARHVRLKKEHARYTALPFLKGSRRTEDYIAWRSTFVCVSCGPICPLCGRGAEIAVLLGSRAAWTHKTNPDYPECVRCGEPLDTNSGVCPDGHGCGADTGVRA